MRKPILHFAHANSYPASTYQVLFRNLQAHYQVQALDMHAHNPAYPVDHGWHDLARELRDELIARYDHPVILVGHSLGGILCLMVASARPDLVRCVVLLDSPVVAGWRALVWRIAKAIGLESRISPARFSARRRHLWADKQAVHAHYANKPVFRHWEREVFGHYLEHGLVPHAQGVTLRFRRDIETAVYRTLPHHLGQLARPDFPVPVGFIGGTDSVECRKAGLAATRRLVGRHFRQVPGSHLFPMESPVLAAEAVHAMIASLLNA